MTEGIRFTRACGQTLKQMQENIGPLSKEGDALLCWVNEGDLYQGLLNRTLVNLTAAQPDDTQVGMTSNARNATNPPPKEAEPWRPELKTVVDEMVGLLAPDQGEMLTAEGRRLFGLASRAQTLLRAASPTGEDLAARPDEAG